ncbi:MAG: hypothetical protein K2X93_25045 [Candidatus Obscuribacterales bacterium]|nr:hypothetical protein [Candidatus Obscuribacterales bacterium]
MRFSDVHFLPFLVVSSIVSFVVGFGCQLWYMQRQLGKDNLSLRRIVGLNLDSLKGSKWSALWRGLGRAFLGGRRGCPTCFNSTHQQMIKTCRCFQPGQA